LSSDVLGATGEDLRGEEKKAQKGKKKNAD